jgi:Gram-negative bacterial TonB protein C-terminal
MKNLHSFLRTITHVVIVAGALLAGFNATQASAQTTRSEFAIKEYLPRAGTSILRDSLKSPRVPVNKRFAELNADERKALQGYYDNFDGANEPPFPAEGLKPVMELLVKMQNKLVDNGALRLMVTIDAAGVATSVKVIESTSPEMAKAAAGVMMYTKFKPALCKGQPCEMDFPLHVEFPNNTL